MDRADPVDRADRACRPGGPERRGPQPRWGRIALVASLALLVFALLAAGGTWLYVRGLDNDLARTDPFSELTGDRPKSISGALNILLVGSDSRDPDAPVDQSSQWRADTIIVHAHSEEP